MTVATTTNRISYTADGILTGFAYTFKIFAKTDLQVYVSGVLQTITTHYVVTGVGSPTGGNVVFGTAPANLASVIILRSLPQTQGTDLPTNDKFPSTSVEDALDKLTMLCQQLNEVDARTLKLAVSSLFSDLTVPDPVAGKYLRWASLTALENADIVASGSIGVPVSVAQGGTGLTAVGAEGQFATSVGGAVAFTPDGRVRLANKNGANIAANDVVVTDPSNDSAVVATTTVGLVRSVLVADATIANNDTGYLRSRGLATVNVQGNVTRGDFLRTSATTKRAETAGTSIVDGVFAVALTTYSGGGAGSVTALLLGVTLGTAGGRPAFLCAPEGAAYPTTNFPELKKNSGTNWVDYTLDYDQTTSEAAYWRFLIPTGAVFSGASIEIFSRQAAATTGTLGWSVTSLTRADAEAFDTAGNTDAVAAAAVKGTVGQVLRQTAALTVTGWAAGEVLLLKIARDIADTVAEDGKLIGAIVRLT